MFNWRIIKSAPKFALVAAVIVGSTGLFLFWHYFRFSFPKSDGVAREAEKKAKIEGVAITLPSKTDNLLVADGDLYELNSGKLLLKDWLREKPPVQIYFDTEFNKIIGRYPLGLIRFNLNGDVDKTISAPSGLVINDALDAAVYAKDKDIFQAGIDTREFALLNEQRVTSIGGIMEQFFAQNIILRTDKILVFRNMNQTLRVDLESGQVTSVKMQMPAMKANRSPDGAIVAGTTIERMKQRFYAYDVENDESKIIPLENRSRITAYAWLSRDVFAFLEGGMGLTIYNRKKQEIEKVLQLPILATAMASPSPTGRFVFCGSFRESVLVDTETKKALPLGTPAQNYQWITDDTLLCARDVPDTNSRGTWLWKVGRDKVRISSEPYTFSSAGAASVLSIQDAGLITFATRGGLFKMKLDDKEAQMFAPLKNPVTQFVYVAKWQ